MRQRIDFSQVFDEAIRSLDDMLAARDYLVDKAKAAGVKVD